MRALTLRQPTPWALVVGGCDVINMPRPAPRGEWCKTCLTLGTTTTTMPVPGGPTATVSWDTVCRDCGGSGFEPLRVLIHAGKQPDRRTHRWVDGWSNTPVNPLDMLPPVDFDADQVLHAECIGDGERWWRMRWNQRYLGALVAVATITGSHEAGSQECVEEFVDRYAVGPQPAHGLCSVWGEDRGCWHWKVSEVVPFAEPVPARGRPGLWKWKPPPDVIAAVEAQLRAS